MRWCLQHYPNEKFFFYSEKCRRGGQQKNTFAHRYRTVDYEIQFLFKIKTTIYIPLHSKRTCSRKKQKRTAQGRRIYKISSFFGSGKYRVNATHNEQTCDDVLRQAADSLGECGVRYKGKRRLPRHLAKRLANCTFAANAAKIPFTQKQCATPTKTTSEKQSYARAQVKV